MEKAIGKWPSIVSAHYVTPEEKARLMAASGGMAAQVSSQIIPNSPKEESKMEPSKEESLNVTGIAAIKVAKNLGIEFVWRTKDKTVISLEEAEKIILLSPVDNSDIYFDFDMFDEIMALQKEQVMDLEQYPLYQETETVENVSIPQQLSSSQVIHSPIAKSPIVRQDPLTLPIEQRRERAWGGTLSAPGIQVYIHPKGVVRVEVVGTVRLQKAIQGNLRVFRVERVIPNTPRTNTAPSQNPQVRYQQNQSDKIPIPIPTPTTEIDFDNIEF